MPVAGVGREQADIESLAVERSASVASSSSPWQKWVLDDPIGPDVVGQLSIQARASMG
jgi:hypothetical protein